jgi:uncharacterized oxidoreductase
MDLTNNKILITGGSSGIGLEMTKRFIERNNKVLICGRSLNKLEKAKMALPELDFFQCDLSKHEDCLHLAKWINDHHTDCNIVINNAALVHISNFYQDDRVIEKANLEFRTNTLAPITLTKLLIPLIEQNANPLLVNVTTGLVYAPRAAYPFYCATKAALHSFTQGLRVQMKDTKLRIVEVMFPAVDTPWHNGKPPKIAISPVAAVDEMIRGLKRGKEEIHVGKVKLIRMISRIAPGFALRKINSLE